MNRFENDDIAAVLGQRKHLPIHVLLLKPGKYEFFTVTWDELPYWAHLPGKELVYPHPKDFLVYNEEELITLLNYLYSPSLGAHVTNVSVSRNKVKVGSPKLIDVDSILSSLRENIWPKLKVKDAVVRINDQLEREQG